MKPVFKCDYCTFMGTEDQVKEHEPTCFDNYDRKSCTTCKHAGMKTLKQFKCTCGKEIPEGKMFENCEQHERKEKQYDMESVTGLFGSLFGGAFGR